MQVIDECIIILLINCLFYKVSTFIRRREVRTGMKPRTKRKRRSFADPWPRYLKAQRAAWRRD